MSWLLTLILPYFFFPSRKHLKLLQIISNVFWITWYLNYLPNLIDDIKLPFLNIYINLKNSSNKLQKNSMLRYCWVFPLSNEPKHIYVGPAVTEPIDFLSRIVEFWDIAHYSQAQSGVRGTQIITCLREISSGTEPGCAARPVSFAYYMSKTSEGISLDNLVKKKQYITPLPHPLPSLECVPPCYNLTTGTYV